ncbi:MAG: hypothetical protein NT116_05590 [Candidatus Parcubacteria bacterium]|nr:hypothetical protein [Candidatus Parcubacteria bacterium]
MGKVLITSIDIIKKGWQIYSKNFRLFLKPIIILAAISIVYLLFQIVTTYINIQSSFLAIITFILAIILVFIYLWMLIVIIKLADALYKNQTIDLVQLYPQSMKKVPSFFWVGIVMGLVVLLGLILLIIPGIIFMVWYYFSSYVNVLEEKNNKGLDALKSSKDLVKGRWFNVVWRLIVPYLIIYLPIYIIEIIIMGIIGITLYASNLDDNMISLILTPFSIILDIFNLCLLPLFMCFPVILYNGLKETRSIEVPKSEAPIQPTV